MAGISSKGSQRDFDYVDDAGVLWGLRLDESNTELVNVTGVGAATAVNRLPPNVKPRKVVVTDVTGAIKRECTVLSLARYTALTGATPLELAATDSNATTSVRVEQKIPEKVTRIIKNFDTGLNDGDNP
jgi:hypothetical protein